MAFDEKEKDKNTAVAEPKESPAAPAAPTAPPATGGYGDYLAAKQTTPAVGGYGDYLAGKTAPVSSAVSGYGDWLATQQKNHEVETAPKEGMTYGDYLAYTGKDPVGDYNAKVRQAELDYQKGLATYGQNAERMAKAGLAKSGYGEYLAGEAFAARGAAVTAAQQEAKTAQQQSFATYGEYLEGLKQKEQQEAEIQAAEQEQQAAVKQQNLANATAAVSGTMENGATVDAAIGSLSGVYDAATLEQVRNNMTTSNLTQALSGSSIQIGLDDTLKGVTDEWLASSSLKDAEGNAYTVASLRKAMQGNNYKFLTEMINTGSSAGLQAYASYHGIGGDLSNVEVVDKIVDHMVRSGALTEDQYKQYVTDKYIANADDLESGRDFLETITNVYQNADMTDEQKEEVLNTLQEYSNEKLGQVQMNGIRWGYKNSSGVVHPTKIWLNQGNGKEVMVPMHIKRGAGISEEKVDEIIPLYSNPREYSGYYAPQNNNQAIELGVLDGQIVINYGTTWYCASFEFNDKTEKFVAWALLNNRKKESV
ncbi:MAG: hypothetical protein E7590_00960 [Ruminococcaceae bacterium]|nr:hypothetical protein [Oscillospiraceae bacterium]